MKKVHLSYTKELQLLEPYTPKELFAEDNAGTLQYSIPRALIEGTVGGCYTFVSEGIMTLMQIQEDASPIPQQLINDNRTLEGWRKIA